MKHSKLLALLLALAMLFALSSCKGEAEASQAPSEDVETTESVEPSVEPDPSEEPTQAATGDAVRFAVLSGPTGVGAAKLLSDSDNGETVNTYDYVVANDNTELVAGLTSGELDIATVASNVALNLYNKTEGGVRIIALGTRGVLHILESGGGTSVNSIADLKGRTIYSAGQGANPEYILRYLLTENGLEPDKDVELIFGEASEISAKLLSGEAEVAMLPVPAATAAIIQSQGTVRAAVDVTEAWNSLGSGSQLIMTAVVARADFIEENPQAVAAFLEEYEASVNYVKDNVDEAAQLVADLGITANAAIAAQAIPQCNLDFISGSDMVFSISDYFELLYSVDPASVGGALPDDAIYYVP